MSDLVNRSTSARVRTTYPSVETAFGGIRTNTDTEYGEQSLYGDGHGEGRDSVTVMWPVTKAEGRSWVQGLLKRTRSSSHSYH